MEELQVKEVEEVKELNEDLNEIAVREKLKLEIKEAQIVLPQINVNLDQLKAIVDDKLKDYSSLVVTAKTLEGSKNALKELSDFQKALNDYRKDTDKKVRKPIESFDEKCKEIDDSVEKTKKPLKAGIDVFVQKEKDKEKDKKKDLAQKIINEKVTQHELRESYAKKITVSDSYLIVSASKKGTIADIEKRVLEQKQLQNQYDAFISTVEACIEMANKRIDTKMTLDDFQYMIKNGATIESIMQEINQRADKIAEAEKPKAEPVKEAEKQVSIQVQNSVPKQTIEPVQQPVFQWKSSSPSIPISETSIEKENVLSMKSQVKSPSSYSVRLEMSVDVRMLKNLLEYMESNSIINNCAEIEFVANYEALSLMCNYMKSKKIPYNLKKQEKVS